MGAAPCTHPLVNPTTTTTTTTTTTEQTSERAPGEVVDALGRGSPPRAPGRRHTPRRAPCAPAGARPTRCGRPRDSWPPPARTRLERERGEEGEAKSGGPGGGRGRPRSAVAVFEAPRPPASPRRRLPGTLTALGICLPATYFSSLMYAGETTRSKIGGSATAEGSPASAARPARIATARIGRLGCAC